MREPRARRATEIDQFDVELFVDDQILVFDILMSDVVAMQVTHRIDELSKDVARQWLVDFGTLLHEFVQINALPVQWHDHLHVVLRIEGIQHLNRLVSRDYLSPPASHLNNIAMIQLLQDRDFEENSLLQFETLDVSMKFDFRLLDELDHHAFRFVGLVVTEVDLPVAASSSLPRDGVFRLERGRVARRRHIEQRHGQLVHRHDRLIVIEDVLHFDQMWIGVVT